MLDNGKHPYSIELRNAEALFMIRGITKETEMDKKKIRGSIQNIFQN